MISYPNRQMLGGFLEKIEYMLDSIREYSQDPIHYGDLTRDQWDQLYHLRRHLKQAEDQAEQLIRSIDTYSDLLKAVKENPIAGVAVADDSNENKSCRSCCNCEYFDMNTKRCELHPEKEAWSMHAQGCDDYYWVGPGGLTFGGDHNV